VILPPLVLFGACVGLWYLFSQALMSPRRRFLVPPPHEVVRVSFIESDTRVQLADGLWSTIRVGAIGLTLAIAIGITLAVLMSQSKLIERAVFPLLVTIQSIPILAMVPLIAILFGTGQRSRVLVCIIISTFPIVLNTLFGLLSAEGGLHDLITLHRGGRRTRLVKVMLPASLPAMFAGLRIAATLAVIGAIVSDMWFGRGDRGLGQLIRQYASNTNEIPKLYGALMVASALGILVFLTFGAVQGVAVGKWYDSKSGGGR
jgi:NitT/TauT family transport system permease protein